MQRDSLYNTFDLDWIGLDWIEVLNILAKALRSDLAGRICTYVAPQL
mgnify:FL=1